LRYSKSGIPDDRLFLVYYGIDINNFTPENKGGRLRHELCISQETPVVGMVSYIYPPKRYLWQRRGIKGHEDLIDALVYVKQQYPDLKGVFVGGAWAGAETYARKVRDYALNRLGESAIFLGTRDDIPQLYQNFDVAVHPSHSENVGGAIESLMMKIPTIATCVGGFPDVMFPGKTGWLVPPKNPEVLANVIMEVLLNRKRAKDMAKEGRKIVKSFFDVRRNAIDMNSIYKNILLKHSKKAKG
jgi:glycosyltransferase involved in cell wall biosynthesis